MRRKSSAALTAAVLVIAAVVCGSSVLAQDAFDLHAATIVNAPDVRDWPATATITGVSFDGTVSRIAFTKQDGPGRWPDVIPPGFSGPIEYTWWLFVQVNGQWVGSGFIEMWNGRDGSGTPSDPDVPSLYAAHWFYSPRWTPMFGHGPIQPGERIGFMVTSGDARDHKGPDSVRERSNVVVFPATDRGSFSFGVVAPPPVVVSPPVIVPPPAPLPSVDVCGPQIAVLRAELGAQLATINQNVSDGRAETRTFFQNVKNVWAQIGEPLLKYVAPAIGAYLLGKKM